MIVKELFPRFHPELIEEINTHGIIKELPAQTELLREGQYAKVIPIVIEGLVKVYSRYGDRELLLYYIHPAESCIISFSSGISQLPSRGYAITETAATLLLLPVENVQLWLKTYPALNTLFFKNYDARYLDMMNAVNHLLFDKMDTRILDYLKEKTRVTSSQILHITHKEIATDLGTAREVVSRILKKLEAENHIAQEGRTIKIK
ncbi:Crp/Fnr family transcriptional regulator [Dokdonia genika]